MIKQAAFLTALLALFATVAVMAFRVGAESNEPEPCNVPDPDWGIYQACYERDRLIDTPEGGIWFWRLNDSNRSAVGGLKTTYAAALVLDDDQGKRELLKAYCPNGCWVPGNEDPLPQVLRVSDSKYAVWAPDKRMSNRHGTDGFIELLDLEHTTLAPYRKKISVRYETEKPMTLATDGERAAIHFKAIKFVDTPSAPSGYTVEEHLHTQLIGQDPMQYTLNSLPPNTSGYDQCAIYSNPDKLRVEIEKLSDSYCGTPLTQFLSDISHCIEYPISDERHQASAFFQN